MIKTKRFFFILLSLVFLALTMHDPHEPFGFEIAGDFNGDGKEEHAKSGTVRQFYPEKADRTDWMIRFSDTSLPDIMAGCCLTYLMVEGDLDDDKADEFSLYQKSANPDDCHFYITTYTFKNKNWKPIIGPFPVNRGCDNFPSLSLLNKVTKDKKGRVYFEVDTGGVVRNYRAF
jgi:hypothetical protein